MRGVLFPCIELVFCLAVPDGKLRERGRELQLPILLDVLVVTVPDPILPGRRCDEEQRVRFVLLPSVEFVSFRAISKGKLRKWG